MRFSNLMRISSPVLCIAIAFTSCKKEDNPDVNPDGTLNVLNDNSGYTSLFDTSITLGGANGSISEIGVKDFTLENNTQLNLIAYTVLPTQQSPLEVPFRLSRNITTGQAVSVPGYVNMYPLPLNIAYDKVYSQFFPYSNIYTVFAEKNGMGHFYGDVDAEVTTGIGNPMGTGDFSYRYPVFNSGGFYGHFSRVLGQPQIGEIYTVFRAGIGDNFNLNYYRFSCLHEVYNDNGTNRYFALGVTADSIQVFEFNFTSFGDNNNYPVFTTAMVNAMPVNASMASWFEDRTVRHYSTDGKILSFMVTELNTNLRSTFVYNFETNTLTQNLAQASLEYAAAGSDIDVDENGDVYYTGVAGNGGNANGVSVYRKSGNAASVVVGSDNFLKTGTVVKLKVFSGKVYLAVSVSPDGSSFGAYQLSVVKQD